MIFDLKNIFIVFGAGSGGNFIAGLVNSLMKNQREQMFISKTGSSHIVHTNRTSLSFGTWPGEDLRFDNDSDREKFYLDHISQEYNGVTEPVVTWTHNYANIPLYRKYLKNSKILTITHGNMAERATCMLMNVTKTLMDKNADIPLKPVTWEKMLLGWQRMCTQELHSMIGEKKDHTRLFADRYDSNYYDLLLYASIRMMSKHFGMFNFFDKNASPEHFVYDHVLYLVKHPTMSYSIGPHIEEFVDSSVVRLPYTYLIENNVQMLIDSLSQLLDRSLTASELEFVNSEFMRYRIAQNQTMLTDPVAFYNEAELKGLEQLKQYLSKSF